MTMPCPSRDSLIRWLSDSDKTALDLHVETCPHCQQELDALYRSSTDDMRELRRVDRMVAEPSAHGIRFPEAPTDRGPLGKLGPYHVEAFIGGGTYGLVFRVYHEALQDKRALKILRPEWSLIPDLCDRFVQEARAAAAVRHPAVVAIHNVETAAPGFPYPYIVMEYVEGKPASARLRDSRRLPVSTVVNLIQAVADGLAAAHSRGIVHRDIKPDNILIESGTGRVRLVDFGVACLGEVVRPQSASASVIGTPAYMSPEAFADPAATDGRSDLFSLGVVFYELVTGARPFPGTGVTEVQAAVEARSVVSLPPQWHSTVAGRDLSAIIAKLLAHSPDIRYSTAADLTEDLNRWRDHEPVWARPHSVTERASLWVCRSPAVATLAGVLLLAAAAVIALVVIWPSWPQEQERPKIAIASETREPIKEVIQKYLIEKGDHRWIIRDFEVNEKALVAYRSGEIDVMMVDDIWVPELVTKGLLCNLKQFEDFQREFGGGELESFFDKELLNVCHYPPVDRDRYYGLPFLANVQLLMYNHDLLQNYKLNLPRDLAELENTLEVASEKQGKPSFAIRTFTGTDIAEIFWQVLHCGEGRGAYLDDDQLTVVIPKGEGQMALNWLCRLKEKHLLIDGAAGIGAEGLKAIFFSEDQFMAFGWPGWVTSGYYDRFKEEGTRPTKVVSMHLMSGQPVLGAWLLSIKKDSKYRDEAYALIRKLCLDPDIQAQLWKNGSLPANKKVDGREVMKSELDLPERDGRHEFYTNGIIQVRNGLAVAKARPRTPHWSSEHGIEKGIRKRFERFMVWPQAPKIEDLLEGIPWLKVK